MQEYLSVGTIINTHGVRGEVKVSPSTSDASRFEYLLRFFVDMSPAGAGRGDAVAPPKHTPLKEFFVEGTRYHKNHVLLKLRGVDDMSGAEALKGREMWIPREEARELEKTSGSSVTCWAWKSVRRRAAGQAGGCAADRQQ